MEAAAAASAAVVVVVWLMCLAPPVPLLEDLILIAVAKQSRQALDECLCSPCCCFLDKVNVVLEFYVCTCHGTYHTPQARGRTSTRVCVCVLVRVWHTRTCATSEEETAHVLD